MVTMNDSDPDVTDISGKCPQCGLDLDAGEIPEEIRHHYGPPYRFSHAVGIYSTDKDRTMRYECPKCGVDLKTGKRLGTK